VLHHANQIDSVYKVFIDAFQQKAQESLGGMAASDAAQVQVTLSHIEAWIVSPEGHAGIWALSLVCNCIFLLLFAVGGGALGARLLARSRRPEI
jgi:hypothetical protein